MKKLTEKDGSVNRTVYLDFVKCGVIPFINKHHSDSNYKFWPDMVSSHFRQFSGSILELTKYQICAKIRKLWFILNHIKC
jgi:hypothetical protein